MASNSDSSATSTSSGGGSQYFPDPEKFRVDDYVPSWEWDPEKQFTGLSRLTDRYHPIEPFFKFDPLGERWVNWNTQFWCVGSTVAVVGTQCYTNYSRLRHPFAGIYTHIFLGTLTYFGMRYYYRSFRERGAQKEAVLRHYIELHPEDFPIIERKKFKHIIADWFPVRT